MPLSAGDRLGPYEILAPIGAGGMGEVYRARDTRLDRVVAIKVSKEQFSKRFGGEARAIAALNHPHICQIHDIGPDYLVLEYIEGRPLRGPIAPEEAVKLALQVASALEEAHANGILHRDLKPANILLSAKGEAKLVDFGLARLDIDADADVTRTIEGSVLGTPAYMPPEQAQGRPLDARSDVFSFGAVLYEMFSGRRAFPGEQALSIIADVIHKEPEPLLAAPDIVRIVTRCLRKSPGERFQSVAELRAALASARSSATKTEQPSIVVLPFANMSRDAEDEYFSDGLAEEIINVLTQIPGLKVIARTSAFAFKGKNEDIRRIAETLGVTNVLEGSVRRSGPRLRITAQLIHADDGMHLWSQRYDREMTDIFAVQDDISAAITEALKLKLTSTPAATRAYVPNLAAYEAYLRALHFRSKITPELYARCLEYLKQAIELDAGWPDPHAILAMAHIFLGVLGLRPLSEVMPIARSEAQLALSLLPSDPNAHGVLGCIASFYDYDRRASEEHFRLSRASAAIPPLVRELYALGYLLPFGRFEEALEEYAQAVAEDPLNAARRGRHAIVLYYAGMYERAIAEARTALQLDETNYEATSIVAHGRFIQGKLTEALDWAENGFRLAPWHAPVAGLLAALLSLSGHQERADRVLATVSGGAVSIGMFVYHSTTGRLDAAIDWYERAIEERHPDAALFAAARYLKPLRDHPRWPKLAKMMNLP